MGLLPDTLEPVTDKELIGRLRIAAELHGPGAGDRALGLILAAVDRDVGLAADAIAMTQRPEWVRELLGPDLGRVGA